MKIAIAYWIKVIMKISWSEYEVKQSVSKLKAYKGKGNYYTTR